MNVIKVFNRYFSKIHIILHEDIKKWDICN